ncbi:hypothetical protein ACIQYS_08180 [Psychrobacillus sp. NPDC096426]|uniref:hypothetical protein n=1 Tax=Psychrobacillus sp. NPDC096426 TaxID=3364491 RepID=UPI003805F471
MSKILLLIPTLLALSSCHSLEPIITEEIVSISITCENANIIDITDDKLIDKIINEINKSKREGTEEWDISVEHTINLETSSDEIISFYLYSGGDVLINGYYVHSHIQNVCKNTSDS